MKNLELVIAGGGLTAARAIKSYRESGGGGQIALLSKESDLPYHRPTGGQRSFRRQLVEAADVAEDTAGRDDLKGRLGIANAKLAYQQYKVLFTGERWQALAARGATKQRCLWASTSTKDPSLRDTLYVDELIGPETISTMPAQTIEAFQDHGRVEARRESDLQEAQYLFNQLYAAGVDYEDVVATLEREGIDKFVASFNELLEGIAEKRQQLASAA